MALVESVTSKPIQYLVNTSYHGDHSYGNYAFPKTTLIIQHPQTQAYIMNPTVFTNDKAFMMKNFGELVGIEDVEARVADILVEDVKTINLGHREVQMRHWGFAQTSGDLFVWVPDAKVMWTGNPVVAIPPALPWLLEGHHRESLATLKEIRDFLPAEAIIVPGHGRPMKPSDLDFTIHYLDTLDNKVQTAIANNLSLEETQQAVTMPTFQGYALFGWVHSGVNVPAVFRALSK
jgi:glyoxylase-like metal-dependent hydrolase (beta-lactamase superfamily II)